MQVKNDEVFTLIEAIGTHFGNNLNNRYLRQALMTMTLDHRTWGMLESTNGKDEYHKYQGFQFDELYERILAFARFIHAARREIQPSLRTVLNRVGTPGVFRSSGTDRVLRDMAVNNFASNLNILSDLVHKLYIKVVELDSSHHNGDPPVYKRMRDLNELGRFLVPK